jgi:hypothetical protein
VAYGQRRTIPTNGYTVAPEEVQILGWNLLTRLDSLPETTGSHRGVSVLGASADLLKDLLETFEYQLRKAGVPVDQLLRPGASRAAVQEEFRSSGLNAPEEVIALLGWHNGRYETIEAASALPVFSVRSLEYLAADRKRAVSRPIGFGEWEWNPNWVHVMGDQFGLAVCCSDDPENPPLVRSTDDDGAGQTQDWQTERQVVSLCTPVTWWIDSMRRGWYVWNKESGTWHRDQQAQPVVRAIYEMT